MFSNSGDPGLIPFEQSLPITLMRALETSLRFFRPLLSEHDLSEQQWRVLRALHHVESPMEVGEVAEATFLLGPSLTRILSNLLDRGLIARTPVPEDQRRAHISITTDGWDLVESLVPATVGRYDEIISQLSEDHFTVLMKLLERVTELDPNSRDDSPAGHNSQVQEDTP